MVVLFEIFRISEGPSPHDAGYINFSHISHFFRWDIRIDNKHRSVRGTYFFEDSLVESNLKAEFIQVCWQTTETSYDDSRHSP